MRSSEVEEEVDGDKKMEEELAGSVDNLSTS